MKNYLPNSRAPQSAATLALMQHKTSRNRMLYAFILMFILLFMIGLNQAFSQCYTPPAYCTNITATNNANYGMGIQNVTLGTPAVPLQINNTTTAGQGTQIWFNYTNMILRAAPSDSVYFSVKGGSSNQTLFRIYIDYNGDGTFSTSAPELVYTSVNLTTVNTIVNGSFVIPSTLVAGNVYRIRVASDGQGLIPQPCGPLTYSAEFEDYTLLVPASTPDMISGNITAPLAPIVGNNTVAFTVTNISTTTITTLDLGYQLDANTPVLESRSSLSIAPGATYTGTFTTPLAIAATGTSQLKVWSSNPNSSGNNSPQNDTICKPLVTYCSAPLNGTYTINPGGSGTNNYKSFGAIDSALGSCGVSGPVDINVTNGVYDEFLIITAIPGISATNRVIFYGNGSTLQYNCNASLYSVVRFQGVRHVTLDSINIKTTSTAYGWGVHMFNNNDSNTVRNCTIDISTVTSSSSTNSAGIVFSNSTSSPTTTGNTCVFNTFQNNYLKGSTSSYGMYYGIVGAASTSGANYQANRFLNNRIENFYVYGVYWTYSNRNVFRGNLIHRPTRSLVTTTYGFYLINQSRLDTFDANVITNLYGGAVTNGSTTYGFILNSYSGTTTELSLYTNNLIYNLKGDGPVYAISINSSFNNRFLNNTISLENTNTTQAQVSYGLYVSGTPSTSNLFDFRNNIISITRPGAGTKYAVYSTGSFASGCTINKNAYYSNSANYIMCNYLGVNYYSLANWKTVLASVDQQSIDFGPNFMNVSTSNYSPRDGAYDGSGDNVISMVPRDYTGATRALPMDIGAFEASPAALDLAIAELVTPAAPYSPGNKMIFVKIRNAGTSTITSATINWMVNGVAQTPIAWTGTLAGGTLSANIALDSVNILSNTLYTISVTVSNPNGSTDPNTANDQLSVQTASMVSGALVINASGSGPGVLPNFTSFASLLKFGGLGGAVTATVAPGSGPYTEQALFEPVAGASATNTITIEGNGETIQADITSNANLGIVTLAGTDYMTVNNLRVRSINASYGVGFLLCSGANYNRISNNYIDIGSVTGSSNSAGIALTSGTSTIGGTGVNGQYNTFENNTITGNSTGGPYYGISLVPSNTTNGTNMYNVVRNNIIRDFTIYGMYMMYSAGSTISGNTISRPTKASPSTFYGIYAVNGMVQDTIENNIIKSPFKGLETSTGTCYGMYMIATNTNAARPLIIRNNQLYDLRSNGAMYPIYQQSAINLRYLNNTVVVDHPTSTSTSTTYLYYNSGTPTTTTLRNNIFYLNRGGSASKYIYYLGTTGTGYVINNNVVHLKQAGTNNYTGYYAGNFATLANWRTANSSAYDQNSVDADPRFRTNISPELYMPGADSVNNIAFATPDVPRDVTGALRSGTPDPGAYEFSVPAADASLAKIVSPTSPLTLGFQTVTVRVKNFGATALTSANLNWEINGSAQTPNSWSGYMVPGDSDQTAIGSYNFSAPGFYRIKAWTSMPNSVNDSFPLNDTTLVTVCTALSGNYYVNPALPANDTNFISVKSFVQTLQQCGVSGAITCNISPGNYNGEIALTGIVPGASATNSITFIGADSATTKIQHDGSVQRATVQMNGAKYYTFRNLTIEATAISGGGFGVLLTNAADSNSFIRCSIKVAIQTVGNSNFLPLLSSGSTTVPNTAGNNGSYNLIDSCRLVGGYYGVSLYNTASPKAQGNIIRNSDIIQPYYYGIIAYYQNQVVINKNRIINPGNNTSATAYSIYAYQCDNGITITKNHIYGQLGGYGIYMGQNYANSTTRNIVANNMIQVGSATNQSFGIFDAGNSYTDIAHNSVNNTSGDASYVSAAIYLNYSSNTIYNNARIVNNVLTAPNGAMAVYCPSTTVLSLSNMFIDKNVYYSPSTYPFRIVNTIYGNLAAYKTAMGAFITACDSGSIFFQPTFFSTTNLRSISPQLDSMGYVIATVPDDIDGNTRSINAPDAGVNEFIRPGEDAGVMTILAPVSPVPLGNNNVKVIIKNYGLNTITGVTVSYAVGATVKSRAYTGSLIPGAVDTVLFDSSSGPSGSDQRFSYTGGSVSMKAYTSNPNTIADAQPLNDTAYTSFCEPLNGIYTINPAGSGTNNFLNFADAVNRLNCGGITGNVTFNIASGTYTGQIDLTTVVGTSDSSKIVFKSVTGNAADVILTSSSSSALDNYTLRLRGIGYTSFERVTIRNTNATYGRVVSINKFTSNNTNTNNIAIRNCVLEGINITSTADQYAVVYGPAGDNATYLTFTNNNIRYGSYSVYLGGQNVISQFTTGLTIDSNTLYQPYWAGLYLMSRNNPKIRNNYLDGNPSYGYYGFYFSGVSGNIDVSQNYILNIAGYYAIYLAQCNYYGEPGLGKFANNIINMTSNNTQYGIYFVNGSAVNFLNNTVRCASTTTSYAYYFSGNTTSITTPQIVASNNVRLLNNILYTGSGYPVYYANFNAVTGTSEANNNLYYTSAATLAYINGTTFAPTTMNTTFRNSLYAGSDRRSLFANIPFTSGTDLKPLVSSPLAWASNGRAAQHFQVNTDYYNGFRSQQVATGAPDIGAIEFTPTSTPPAASFTGSIGTGNTQHMLVFGDTVGKIVWGFAGTLPSSIGATYHTGALISDPTNGGRNPGAQYMDVFWRITASGGSSYNYDLSLTFDPNMLGTVPSMSDMKLAKKQTGVSGTWTHYGSTMTTVDSLNYNFGVTGLSDFSDFTATTDLAPLPVKLNLFEAMRSAENALLYWTTASEKNSLKFIVERSLNGEEFEVAGEVKAAGNSDKVSNYQFVDENAADLCGHTLAYYRLKMVDKDGSFEYSPVRVVRFDENAEMLIRVYPNPFKEDINISWNETFEGEVDITVCDLIGKVVFKGKVPVTPANPVITVSSLGKLPAGIYVVKAEANGKNVVKKVLKD